MSDHALRLAEADDAAGLKAHLDQHPESVDARDEMGNTPLILSCKRASGGRRCVYILCEAGANVNLVNHNGTTPLMWATHYCNSVCVELLLQRGAQAGLKATAGPWKTDTALVLARKAGNDRCLRLLEKAAKEQPPQPASPQPASPHPASPHPTPPHPTPPPVRSPLPSASPGAVGSHLVDVTDRAGDDEHLAEMHAAEEEELIREARTARAAAAAAFAEAEAAQVSANARVEAALAEAEAARAEVARAEVARAEAEASRSAQAEAGRAAQAALAVRDIEVEELTRLLAEARLRAQCSGPPPSGARLFSYDELDAATTHFEYRLGAGGFGAVYRGVLPSGTPLAVKRLEQDESLGVAAGIPSSEQLRTEVELLSKAVHPNVVPLLGWCVDGPASCLVYALMEGGALEDRLAMRHAQRPALTSSERCVILSDVARGLAYLHTELRIVHRDVKSANVLLDRGGIGRLGDFGIARQDDDVTSAAGTARMRTHMLTSQ